MRRHVTMMLASALLGVSLVAASDPGADWTPPLGIPAPSFGITDAAPSPSSARAFYYVDASSPAADDSGNTYGSAGRPRRTIPDTLPAGAVVELHGEYSTPQTSPHGIHARGTAEAPVFIRGVSAADRPRITSCWEISGSYLVVENVEFAGCGGVVLLAPIDHAVLRHSDIHGSLQGGGVGVQSWNGGDATDVVIYDNLIHDNGDVHASYDQDAHGIAVGPHVSGLWVVDNKLYRNSGDGIQINAGSRALQATTNHIWVGRNVAFDNKQSGFWVKQAVDVIFSQNYSARHRPSNSSSGVCMGGQYAPEHVWFIDNQVWDCDYGIQIASDSDLGFGRYVFIVGNLIARIHDSIGQFNAQTAWQNCGISLPGGVTRFVLENTIYDVDSGVCAPNGSGVVYLYDNIIDQVSDAGYHLFFESTQLAARSIGASDNLFGPDYRLRVGTRTIRTGPGGSPWRGRNGVVADMGWVDPANGDMRLKHDSPAIDRGVMPQLQIWKYYQQRYGASIASDLYGTPRPIGSASDIGATEWP
jgi:Right handed beta helix region